MTSQSEHVPHTPHNHNSGTQKLEMRWAEVLAGKPTSPPVRTLPEPGAGLVASQQRARRP